ncbi:MAG: F0F1 ATP synthase subunit A [Synechococcaceae cyanobacterium]|nr:F0F1 ATP synthase subunit A [Synechococcaceae cyanobacterium]
MQLSPDTVVIARWGAVTISATLVFTWLTMLLLVVAAAAITRRLVARPPVGRLQVVLETVVEGLTDQIREITGQDPEPYLPFIGTLFLFILTSNLLTIVPGYQAPTGSLSTTVALALCVFFAVPIYGISSIGLRRYLRSYLQPTPLMLPFQIIAEFSRTLALAMRLFGNIMSGNLITAILLSIVPFFVPVLMQALGLVFGVIQAYVFSVLALVYISSAATIQRHEPAPAVESSHE